MDKCANDSKEEHLRLASIIKDCHDKLRSQSKLKGMKEAWSEHLQNTALLKQYSTSMHRLASIWEANTTNPNLYARSRVKWIIDYCNSYFFTNKVFLEKRDREQRLAASYTDISTFGASELRKCFTNSVNVLDVGSCFNPFVGESNFNVTAIDLCPATIDVLKGDFLKIMVDKKIIVEDGEVLRLPCEYYDCVIFSLLLEYIPSPEERLHCCQKAYELLQAEGILIIITPDSQHVGKNAKLMKNWRYTLGTLGFYRICFEKLAHITCMVFRKSLIPAVAQRWAELHREDYMSKTINIPQDKV
ncbi:PREDICTED: probable methyltransferase BTM2 homolog [Bactrocera latifrons]|uniref:S-adenosylmethionine sensor upstream of mTORC1 n=1 Tax=Bactrocera latifrons TaxID=174628 RepID=A0A0K8UVB3_BACLA|nr:PREDICTED: probable methyltransferase BTM2 homolog [Bactrocera latifrons]